MLLRGALKNQLVKGRILSLGAVLLWLLFVTDASAAQTMWLAWQMHQSTSTDHDAPPYWYKPWSPMAKPVSVDACLALVKKESGRRRVLPIQWYAVTPDAPPDYAKWIGCLPLGFDPEDPPK